MKMKLNFFLFSIFYCLSMTPIFSAVQWVPVARLDLWGGQFFFEGERTSFSGNGDWVLTPGIKFSDRFSLIPTVTGKYRRSREVQELIGGGFLTRENLENSVIVKGIMNLNDQWKTKLKSSYKNQLLVESSDEKLGKGLFDNNKLGFGLELERNGTILRSARISLDPYAIRFNRYKSLASSSQFGSEINSGEDTLDFNGYDATLSADLSFSKKWLGSALALASYRTFTEQKTVTTSGLFTNDKRKDFYGTAAAGISRALPTWDALKLQAMFGVDLSFSFLKSDQHNYDATRTRFNESYYDYSEAHILPKLAGRFWGKLDWGIVYDFGRREYAKRVVQSADGTYGSEKIYLDTHTLSYSLKYPLRYGFSFAAQGTYRQSKSNMKFERTYRYNYVAQHYFLGISWEH